jgi:hypothetical protein
MCFPEGKEMNLTTIQTTDKGTSMYKFMYVIFSSHKNRVKIHVAVPAQSQYM